MRKYRVRLESPKGYRLVRHLLAPWYDTAASDAQYWANLHPEHGKQGPWVAKSTEVAA